MAIKYVNEYTYPGKTILFILSDTMPSKPKWMLKIKLDYGSKNCTFCSYTGTTYKELATHYITMHKTMFCVYCTKWKQSEAKLAHHLGQCHIFKKVMNRKKKASQ